MTGEMQSQQNEKGFLNRCFERDARIRNNSHNLVEAELARVGFLRTLVNFEVNKAIAATYFSPITTPIAEGIESFRRMAGVSTKRDN